jgi:hypothetical protein
VLPFANLSQDRCCSQHRSTHTYSDLTVRPSDPMLDVLAVLAVHRRWPGFESAQNGDFGVIAPL